MPENAEERVLRARMVWLGPGRHLAPGVVRIVAGRVVAVERARGAVPPRALFPGLVDAHVHLQIPALEQPERDFVRWIGVVMRMRAQADEAAHRAAAEDALRGLCADGVTAVGEVDSTGCSIAALRQVQLAGVCYRELVGFDLAAAAARAQVDEASVHGTRRCRAGLSPHAPYSVSPALFRSARRTGRLLAIHVAETPAEQQFLRTGRGPFRNLLQRLGKLSAGFRAPGVGAVEWLDGLGMLGPRTTLIHAQCIDRRDAERVAARRSPVVVCPGTIHYFRRPPPPVEQWLAAGIRVALGTDSRASNTGLSMRGEMALARRLWPALDGEQVLAMASSHGGAALGRPSLGRIGVGRAADLVEYSMPDSAMECIDAFTRGAAAPDAVWLAGRRFAGAEVG